MPVSVLYAIEEWCFHSGLDAHVLGFSRGRLSNIVVMTGDCFFCRIGHNNNHWVLIASPGYNTIRVRCHHADKAQTVMVDFAEALRDIKHP